LRPSSSAPVSLIASKKCAPISSCQYGCVQPPWAKPPSVDGLDPVQAALIRSAVDGVYYNEIVGNPSLPEPLRSALFHRLLAMTRESLARSYEEEASTG
jgi:hypothetical protein